MISTDDPDDKRKTRRPDALFDPWAGWKPAWTTRHRGRRRKNAAPATPHDHQETHSPTEAVEMRLSAERTTTRSQRRIVDARLWDAMTPAQQDAALEIDFAFQLLSKGLGFRMSDPHRLRHGRSHGSETERQARRIAEYFDWAKSCKRENLCHAAVIDILCHGKSCRESDRARRVRNGWSRSNLLEALFVYCEMRGWPAR